MKCVCTNANGEPKALFYDRRTAERRADILRREKGWLLSTYECEYGLGWHLTKRW